MTVTEKIVLDSKTRAFVDGLAAQRGKPIYELSYEDAAKYSKMPRPMENGL